MASPTSSTPSILLLNLPPKTFVGINLASFNSSPNFHGITNIPQGLHFLYTGTDRSLSIRHGHWLRVSHQSTEPQIFVLRWNHEHELLELLESTNHEVVGAARTISALQGKGLVDYSALRDASASLQSSQSNNNSSASNHEADSEDPWPQLTSHISPRALTRILCSPSDLQNTKEWILSSISSGLQDTETIPGLTEPEVSPILHEAGSSTLNFASINLKQTWPSNAIGRDRTDKARDKSWYLSHIIDNLAAQTQRDKTTPAPAARQTGAKEVLAELQFCFLMVLTLANYSCLEQWKRLLGVILGCKSALNEVEGYFVEVVKVLRSQLGRVEDVEGGLFEMGDEVGSLWLRHLLKGFRANVDEASREGEERGALDGELQRLELWLGETYGWADESAMLKRGMLDLEDGERIEVQMDGLDEEEESGEYAPVIVEM